MIALSLLALLSNTAQSKTLTATALALYGVPKYQGNFDHFDYLNPEAPKGGSITLPASGSFDTLNPYTLKGISPSESPGAGMYGISEANEPLMTGTGSYLPSGDEPQTAYCLICENLEYPPDYKWVIFQIRDEARFHNGDPITSDDVVFSFNTLTSNLAYPYYRNKYRDVEKVEKLTDKKVRFFFKVEGNRSLILRAGELPVMSSKFWSNREFGNTTTEPQPLSGPYKISKFKFGQFVEFERESDHWGKSLPQYQGSFNFNKVRFVFFRERTVAFEAFKSGEIDVFFEYVAKNWATAYQFPALENGKVIKEEIPHSIPSGTQAFFLNMRKKQFNDIRVRKALTLLFDYEWTNKKIFHDAYERNQTYYPNSEAGAEGPPSPQEIALLHPWKNKVPEELYKKPFQLPVTSGNGNIRKQLREALALLKEAGWIIRDGKLVDSRGKPFTFEVLIEQRSFERVLMPYVKNLQRAGITVHIRMVDHAQYKVRLDAFDFDVISYVLPQSLSPGQEQRLYFHSSQADTPGSKNFSGIKNTVVDHLVEKIGSADSRTELINNTRSLDRVLLWNYYTIPHWHLNYHRIAYWNKFARPTPGPSLTPGFPGWWLDN